MAIKCTQIISTEPSLATFQIEIPHADTLNNYDSSESTREMVNSLALLINCLSAQGYDCGDILQHLMDK